MPLSKTPLSATDLESLHDQGINYFETKWNSGAENERFQKGNHWDADKENKIKARTDSPIQWLLRLLN